MEIKELDPFHFVKKGRKEIKISNLVWLVRVGRAKQEQLLLLAKVMELVATHQLLTQRCVFSEHYFIDLNKKENSEAFR